MLSGEATNSKMLSVLSSNHQSKREAQVREGVKAKKVPDLNQESFSEIISG